MTPVEKDRQLAYALEVLKTNNHFQTFVGWLRKSQEEYRQLAETPGSKDPRFFNGAAASLGEQLKLIEKDRSGATGL